jgi:hypothetical protein
MNMCRSNQRHNANAKAARVRPAAAAFTVVELMVAISLMTLIVLALYSMFNQTQRAMRANESQVDSSERGRGVLELVSRELESARVGFRQDATNLWLRTPIGITNLVQNDSLIGQQGTNTYRMNLFDDVYYLTKSEKAWRGVGYVVLTPTTNSTGKDVLGRPLTGLGTLYRYETPPTNRDYLFPATNLFTGFVTNLPAPNANNAQMPPATNFSQVAQGIVHFRVLPFDTKGQVMTYWNTNIDSTYRMVRWMGSGAQRLYPFSNIRGITNANVVLSQASQADTNITFTSFRSNAIPAYLELELGVLEPDAIRVYQQMMKDEQPAQARAFLEKRIAKVQIFRKRIPLRTVDQ